MKKQLAITLSATALSAAAMAIAPIVTAPMAGADVCAGVDGRHFSVNGCDQYANTGADSTGSDATVESSFAPYIGGEAACYTMEGVPYFTPPGHPC